MRLQTVNGGVKAPWIGTVNSWGDEIYIRVYPVEMGVGRTYSSSARVGEEHALQISVRMTAAGPFYVNAEDN